MRFPLSSVSEFAYERRTYAQTIICLCIVSFAGSEFSLLVATFATLGRKAESYDSFLVCLRTAPNFFNIVSEMRDPREFTKAMLCCQTVVTSTYLVSLPIVHSSGFADDVTVLCIDPGWRSVPLRRTVYRLSCVRICRCSNDESVLWLG